MERASWRQHVSRRCAGRLTLFLMILIQLAVAGSAYCYARSQSYQNTDDAFIDSHIVNVAPKVAGRVDRVLVNDNEPVKKGDLLVVLDDRDFAATIDQKAAALDSARAQVAEARATADTHLALLKSAQAQIEEAAANLKAAKLNQSYTQIRAPEDGRVIEKAVEPGDCVQAEQALFALATATPRRISGHYEGTR